MSSEIAAFYATIGADVKDFKRGLGDVKADMGALDKTTAALGSAFKLAFGLGVTAIAGFTAVVGKSVSAAAEMEQGVADIGAMMSLTAEDTAKLGDHILELGLDPNLKVSATEASAAIMALGTAGLSVSEIMGGASESTVLLANATGLKGEGLATAATIATDVMAQFGIEARDMGDAVSDIAGVTVASKFSIDDYRLALGQAGGVASGVGVSFEDFNAIIAASSSMFTSGADAGTSFKTFLTTLIPKSNEAKEVMIQLGLATADGTSKFFDAAGSIKSAEEIAGLLQETMGGLSDAQRNAALNTMFGSDASRTAIALIKGGIPVITEMKTAIGNVSAEELAATRMNTFAGSMEIAQGVMETLQISIGQKFLPVLRPLVDKFSELATQYGPQVIDFFGKLADGITSAIQQGIDWTTRVIPPLWKGFIDITSAVKTLLAPVTDMTTKWVKWQDVLVVVGAFLIGPLLGAVGAAAVALVQLAAPIVALVAAVAALRTAWETDFGGIRTDTLKFFEGFTEFVRRYSGIWKGDWGKTLDFFKNNTAEAFRIMGDKIEESWRYWTNEVRHIVETWISQTRIKIEGQLAVWKSQFHIWWGWIERYFREGKDAAIDMMERLFGWFKPHEWLDKGRDIIQGLWDGAKQIWTNFRNWWDGIWDTLTGTVDVKLKIASPSKLMAEKGRMTMEGYALGIEEAMPKVTDALGKMPTMAAGAVGSSDIASGTQDTRTVIAGANSPMGHDSAVLTLLQAILNELRRNGQIDERGFTMLANNTAQKSTVGLSGLVSFQAGLR